MDIHKSSAFAFGVMDGVINVLGILIGVYGATGNRLAIISAVLAGSIANGVANASGIHVAKEVEGIKGHDKIFLLMAYGFFASLFAGIFPSLPLLFFPIKEGVMTGFLLGLLLLFLLGYLLGYLAENWRTGIEYSFLGLVASLVTFLLGKGVATVI